MKTKPKRRSPYCTCEAQARPNSEWLGVVAFSRAAVTSTRFTVLADHPDQGVDDRGVKLRSCRFPQLANRFGRRQRGPVSPVGRHRLVRVRYGDDPRVERKIGSTDAIRVSSSIHPLVMMADAVDVLAELVNAADDFYRFDGVPLDDLVFLVRKAARLVEDAAGNGDLADVVKERRTIDALHGLRRKAHLLGDRPGEVGHPFRVLRRIGILGVDGADKGADRLLVELFQI